MLLRLVCIHLLLSLLLGLLQSLFKRLLLQDPVVHEVEVETLAHERLPEHRDDLLVVRSLLELQLARVVEEVAELPREPVRQVLHRCNCLFNLNLLILLLFCLGWKTLPRQTALDKVHENHTYLL